MCYVFVADSIFFISLCIKQKGNTMSEINLSITHIDEYATLKEIFLQKGKRVEYAKKEYFILQNQISSIVGWVESGTFHHTCQKEDVESKEHVVCFSFPGEFVSDYASFIHREPAFVNIQAISNCVVYQLSYKDLTEYWETNMVTQRLGRNIAEIMFKMTYKRMLQLYCDTPEERYIALMQRCPDIKERVPLREIASFLGVTPETVSHIRRKLLYESKS